MAAAVSAQAPLSEDAEPESEPSPPPAEVQAAYTEVVARAVTEFNARRFAEARALFLRGHELWPSARTWRTLGMTAFELRMYPQALSELQAALDDVRRPLPDDLRAQVLSLVEQARAFVGRYRLRIVPADAELLVDGAPHPASAGVLLLAVGEHTLVARAPGYPELRRTLMVQGREDEELVLALAAPVLTAEVAPAPAVAAQSATVAVSATPTPESAPGPGVAAWTALGVGAAGLIAGGVFAGLSLSHKGELSGKCPDKACPEPYDAQRREMQTFADIATVGLAVSAAGVAGFLILWLTDSPAPAEAERTAELRLFIGPASAGVSGRF